MVLFLSLIHIFRDAGLRAVLPLLGLLTPLARQQHHRRAAGAQDGGLHRRLPVGDHSVILAVGGEKHADIGADGLHLLGAGVVLGEDNPVGPLSGGVAHALPAVDALAAGAAEEDGQLPAGVLRPDGAQGVL